MRFGVVTVMAMAMATGGDSTREERFVAALRALARPRAGGGGRARAVRTTHLTEENGVRGHHVARIQELERDALDNDARDRHNVRRPAPAPHQQADLRGDRVEDQRIDGPAPVGRRHGCLCVVARPESRPEPGVATVPRVAHNTAAPNSFRWR